MGADRDRIGVAGFEALEGTPDDRAPGMRLLSSPGRPTLQGLKLPGARRIPMDYDEIAERMLVSPGKPLELKDFNPDWLLTEAMESLGKERAKEEAEVLLE